MARRFTSSLLFGLLAAAVLAGPAAAFECVDFEARPWSQFIAPDTGDCSVNEAEGRCMELDEVESAVETDAGSALEEEEAPSRHFAPAGACYDPSRCEGIPPQPTTRLAHRAPQTATDDPDVGLRLSSKGWFKLPERPMAYGLSPRLGVPRDIDWPPES